jgi:hypothetical protein
VRLSTELAGDPVHIQPAGRPSGAGFGPIWEQTCCEETIDRSQIGGLGNAMRARFLIRSHNACGKNRAKPKQEACSGARMCT